MKYDNLLKTIFHEAMPSVLRVLRCAPIAEYLSVEFPSRPKLVAGVVARLADGRILHLEFQLTNDPRMHWRCYHYFGAIQERWEEEEVVQVVIYLGNGPVTMKREIKRKRLDYSYDILDMHQLVPEIFLKSHGDSERVLALLCDSQDPRKTIRQVLASWKHLSRQELLENIDRLRTLAQLRGTEIIAKEGIEQMPLEFDITKSIFFKEGEQHGLKVGLRTGLKQGRKKGEATALARVLTRLLEQRFGPVSETVHERVTKAAIRQLEIWALRAPKARKLKDVFAD